MHNLTVNLGGCLESYRFVACRFWQSFDRLTGQNSEQTCCKIQYFCVQRRISDYAAEANPNSLFHTQTKNFGGVNLSNLPRQNFWRSEIERICPAKIFAKAKSSEFAPPKFLQRRNRANLPRQNFCKGEIERIRPAKIFAKAGQANLLSQNFCKRQVERIRPAKIFAKAGRANPPRQNFCKGWSGESAQPKFLQKAGRANPLSQNFCKRQNRANLLRQIFCTSREIKIM